MIEYDTFKLKDFFKILKDDTLLKEHGIKKEEWDKLKEEWDDKHPGKGAARMVESHRKVVIEGLKIKRDLTLFNFLLTYTDDPREFYEAGNIPFKEDPIERFKDLQKRIKKSKRKLEIFSEQRDKLEEEMKSVEEEETDVITDINEVLASFEIAGIGVGNYEKLTLGRYDGLTKAFEKKAASGKRNN